MPWPRLVSMSSFNSEDGVQSQVIPRRLCGGWSGRPNGTDTWLFSCQHHSFNVPYPHFIHGKWQLTAPSNNPLSTCIQECSVPILAVTCYPEEGLFCWPLASKQTPATFFSSPCILSIANFLSHFIICTWKKTLNKSRIIQAIRIAGRTSYTNEPHRTTPSWQIYRYAFITHSYRVLQRIRGIKQHGTLYSIYLLSIHHVSA